MENISLLPQGDKTGGHYRRLPFHRGHHLLHRVHPPGGPLRLPLQRAGPGLDDEDPQPPLLQTDLPEQDGPEDLTVVRTSVGRIMNNIDKLGLTYI